MVHQPHLVQFYADEAFLIEALASFVRVGLQVNDTLIIVATPAHICDLGNALTLHELENTNLIFFDAVSVLADVMGENYPDQSRFMEVLGNRIKKAAREGRVRVFGEMVPLLWAARKYDAAVRLKTCWNELQIKHQFSLMCAYPHSALPSTADAPSVLALCHEATQVHYQKPSMITGARG